MEMVCCSMASWMATCKERKKMKEGKFESKLSILRREGRRQEEREKKRKRGREGGRDHHSYLLGTIHLIELINATDAIIGQHQRSCFHAELPCFGVFDHTGCETGSRGGLA